MSYFRLKGHELIDKAELTTDIHPQLEGHLPMLERWMRHINAGDLLDVEIDDIAKKTNLNKNFKLDRCSMDKSNPICGYPPDPWLSGLSHLC